MRADRLLSLMMLLQTRGQITADALAKELDVSPRTIYRDIDALSMAGVPVYANGGPGGGYALLDSYRTTLTGLNEEEIRALFMLTIPTPLAQLGMNQQLKGAILKLTSSFNHEHQEKADALRQRIYLDSAGWFQSNESVPYLKMIQEAVWQDRQLIIFYRRRNGVVTERHISPYALVAKASVWYVVAETDNGMRVYRVARIDAVQLTETHFTRPVEFDLPQFWSEWVAEYESSVPQYPVTLQVSPQLTTKLPYILGKGIRPLLENTPPNENGWRTIAYTFERIEEAQAFVLSMGAGAKVIAPKELRDAVLVLAKEVVAGYGV